MTGSCTGSFARRRFAGDAFTLVEILIVVVIIGILAAIAVPKLSNASQVAREDTMKNDLRFLRTQITIYGSQHHDVFPGYPGGDNSATATDTDFVQQMTRFTDEFGVTSTSNDASYTFGPYLTQMPENPVNVLTTIKIIDPDGSMDADASTGWLYQPSTGAILPNLLGSDTDGKPYASY